MNDNDLIETLIKAKTSCTNFVLKHVLQLAADRIKELSNENT